MAAGPPIKLHQIIQLVGVEDFKLSGACLGQSITSSAGSDADVSPDVSGVSVVAMPLAFKILGQPKSFIVVAKSAGEWGKCVI